MHKAAADMLNLIREIELVAQFQNPPILMQSGMTLQSLCKLAIHSATGQKLKGEL